jgi:hypothetical protein
MGPLKYYRGLTKAQRKTRKAEINKFGAMHWRNPAAYVGFKTDKGRKTKRSGYTVTWRSRFPDARSLQEKAEVTGVPLRFIRASYNRGLAAWRTGHRPGATQQQWGYARVHSFLLCGKTALTTDSDLRHEAIRTSVGGKRWFTSVSCLS